MLSREGFNKTHWFFITIYFFTTILSAFWISPFAPILTVLSIFIVVCLHGIERYGLKNLFIFFMITWFVSHFFEALSIQVGFPFGHYVYAQLAGPRLFQVPLIIMLAYFGTGYASWILSTILLNQYQKKLSRQQIFWVPFIAAFIMVMWDLCMDPVCSTANSLWIWRDGGPYFGVPMQNYAGWFFVVYIIFQLFSFYIARHDTMLNKPVFTTKIFWLEAVAVYGIQGMTQLVGAIGATKEYNIYYSMALVTVFTMMFVTLLSYRVVSGNEKLT